ncbi:RagB/SusD family nutrient uptake outer membrane protein [Fulvivirga kasyanovii]|uniref:RagB/SusD family nutrient uptake outer membrane protein n=1 Tax=Fulvivirga kasyanovii TaxID=396812 RepID=A0ABW9RUD1_9BACT|nr:RagB/SusD family nutrient uptake outer membrane protein [Fulvivirga kasyanovii]MTI27832.1 RagB/SusD family nutrient uptake outer membrane protein [Fulvivirga kasyanovii]
MIINTKRYLKYILVTICQLTFFGCSDDYVDIDPAATIDADSYFNSPQDYEDAVVGAYDLLQASYINVWVGDIASDNTLAGGENANDVIALQEIDDMRHGAVNDQLRNIWSWMYAGISRTNYIFENKDKIDFEGKEQILAEAAFLRAYYYFELVKIFGDLPLIVDERATFEGLSSIPRSPKAEVYTQIEKDLEYAAANLDVTPAQLGRATKGAALALLGKAHLYQDEFSEAADALEQVIGLGVYDLFDDYSTLFLTQNENNIESVFEIQYTNEEGAGFECLQCVEGNVAVGFNGIRGYDGPLYADGFSFNVPTQDLVDAFESGDLRFEPTILDIEAFAAAQEEEVTYTKGYEHTGYYNHKYIPRAADIGQGDVHLTSPVNYRAIRYADVLLMAAEALNRGGIDDSKALGYLNEVRDRADLDQLSLTGQNLTDAILKERRVELAGEGHRFFDLVRTGQAAANIDGFVAGKHEVFPIPQIEIDLAGAGWKQNDNY